MSKKEKIYKSPSASLLKNKSLISIACTVVLFGAALWFFRPNNDPSISVDKSMHQPVITNSPANSETENTKQIEVDRLRETAKTEFDDSNRPKKTSSYEAKKVLAELENQESELKSSTSSALNVIITVDKQRLVVGDKSISITAKYEVGDANLTGKWRYENNNITLHNLNNSTTTMDVNNAGSCKLWFEVNGTKQASTILTLNEKIPQKH